MQVLNRTLLKSNMYRVVIFSVLIVLNLTSFCYSGNNKPFIIRIKSVNTKNILIDFSVKSGDRFYLNYIHSADKIPIRDTFKIGGEGELILIEEAFLCHSAGLEFQRHGDILLFNDGMWTKVKMNRFLPEFIIRVGRISEQLIIIQNKPFRLDSLVKPGESILIYTMREGE